MQYDAIASLTNGTQIGDSGRSVSGSGHTLLERVKFSEPLNRIVSFQMRSRQMKAAVFTKVVLPPLP